MLTLAEFCTGTGGMTLSFENTNNVQTIYSTDYEPSSKIIYDANFSNELVLKDIHDIDISSIPTVDIITAGFPCQPFSIAGNRDGFNDERSNVFLTLIKIISHTRPKCVLFENVKNLLSHDNGNSMITILNLITDIGYYCKFDVLNTCELTRIPQNRERVFIVCFRDEGHLDLFNFPTTQSTTLPIIDFLEENVSDKYYYNERFVIWDRIENEIVKHIDTNTVYQYRRGVVRENKSNVCPTLTAIMGMGGHNVPLVRDSKGIRKLTPRECFNLQGFPETYVLPNISDSKLYKLVGNAISVDIVEQIAQIIVDIITQN